MDSQLSKLPEMNTCVPCPPHRKTVGSLRTFILIPEGMVLVRIPIAVFDSHCITQKHSADSHHCWQRLGTFLSANYLGNYISNVMIENLKSLKQMRDTISLMHIHVVL